jgi:superfamily II DNA or RNA helicase
MDSKDAIAKFVNGEVKLIVGTSAISTGVDLKPTQCLIYLQGGTSEIKVKQAIGRGTRMGVEGKTDFWVVDFLVNGSKTCTKHALVRKELYEELMGTVDIVGKYDAE